MKGKKETKTKQILTTTTTKKKKNDIVGTTQIESAAISLCYKGGKKPRGKETEKDGLQHFLRLGLSHARTAGLPSRRERERY